MSLYDKFLREQRERDLDKHIRIGEMVKIECGYLTNSGIGKVIDRYERDGILRLKVLRIMKLDRTLIKYPKEIDNKVQYAEKFDVRAYVQSLKDEADLIFEAFDKHK